MKILVTGGAGFIGSNFIKWVLKTHKDVSIINLDALTYAGNLANLKEEMTSQRLEFVKGSICDSSLVQSIVSQVDAVINFAAESHVDRSIEGPKIFLDTNISGTFTLLEATKKIKPKIRFVQVSTDEVYGSLGPTGKFTEDTPMAPNSPYSASKASADMLVRAYHHTFQLDTITTRCTNNYGPYQFPEKLIPLMISNAIDNKKLPVYGNGLNVRDWIYVEDHCSGVWSAFEKGRSGEVYNFGGNAEKTNIEIVRNLLKLLNRDESLIEFVKDRPGHDLRYAIEVVKSKEELGWTPKMKFEEGLNATVNWYLNNKKWTDDIKSGAYRNLKWL